MLCPGLIHLPCLRESFCAAALDEMFIKGNGMRRPGVQCIGRNAVEWFAGLEVS